MTENLIRKQKIINIVKSGEEMCDKNSILVIFSFIHQWK